MVVVSPGTYIRAAREAGAKPLTREDVAIGLDSVPPVSARARAELLEQIEADLVPVSVSTAVALASVIPCLDLEHLAELVDAHPAERAPAPRLTRAAAPASLWLGLGGEATA
jgi:hypothetical protein